MNHISKVFRTRWILWVVTSILLRAPAYAAALDSMPILAQGGEGISKLKKLFAGIIYLVMVVGLIFGIIKVIQGAMALTQGEQGWGQIIGGAMIAAAPTIMYFAFDIAGLGGVSITTDEIIGASSGR